MDPPLNNRRFLSEILLVQTEASLCKPTRSGRVSVERDRDKRLMRAGRVYRGGRTGGGGGGMDCVGKKGLVQGTLPTPEFELHY